MSFVDKCINDSLPLWDSFLNLPFLRELADGSLDEARFMGYIVDDSLYLREYAKVFAWGMTKAQDMASIRTLYSLLSFINEGEGATRLQYLKRYGLTDDAIQPLPQRPENKAYTDYMIQVSQQGEGIPECMMASLPCMLSYSRIFRQIISCFPSVRETPYWSLVQDYAGESYDAACREWTAYADKVCADLSPARQQQCMEIFRTCSLHEQRFWQMCEQPRADFSCGHGKGSEPNE